MYSQPLCLQFWYIAIYSLLSVANVIEVRRHQCFDSGQSCLKHYTLTKFRNERISAPETVEERVLLATAAWRCRAQPRSKTKAQCRGRFLGLCCFFTAKKSNKQYERASRHRFFFARLFFASWASSSLQPTGLFF